jgi:predicted transcriptional regulator
MSEQVLISGETNEVIHRLPKTFQIFVSLIGTAKNVAKETHRPQHEPNDEFQTPSDGPPLESSEFELICQSLSHIGVLILQSIRGDGSSSKELAANLGVSAETIKRRYKDLLKYGMIKTAPKCGARLTQKGYQFINRFKSTKDMVSIDTRHPDTNDTIATI